MFQHRFLHINHRESCSINKETWKVFAYIGKGQKIYQARNNSHTNLFHKYRYFFTSCLFENKLVTSFMNRNFKRSYMAVWFFGQYTRVKWCLGLCEICLCSYILPLEFNSRHSYIDCLYIGLQATPWDIKNESFESVSWNQVKISAKQKSHWNSTKT